MPPDDVIANNLEHLTDAVNSLRDDVRMLRSMEGRLVRVEMAEASCPGRTRIADIERQAESNTNRISALEESRSSMWKLIGGTLVTILVAALLFILQNIGWMPMAGG